MGYPLAIKTKFRIWDKVPSRCLSQPEYRCYPNLVGLSALRTLKHIVAKVWIELKAVGVEGVIWIFLVSAFRICFRGTGQPRDERFDHVFFRMLQGIFEAISEAEHQGQTEYRGMDGNGLSARRDLVAV